MDQSLDILIHSRKKSQRSFEPRINGAVEYIHSLHTFVQTGLEIPILELCIYATFRCSFQTVHLGEKRYTGGTPLTKGAPQILLLLSNLFAPGLACRWRNMLLRAGYTLMLRLLGLNLLLW